MERLAGVHIDGFLARNPSQEESNELARKIVRAWYRMMYAGRMLYIDMHPGNFLAMDDGRLGVVDFGNITHISDDLWEVFRKMDRPLTTGDRRQRIECINDWMGVTDEAAEADRVRLGEEYADWAWRARSRGGVFDFDNEFDFRRGVELFAEMVRKRYNRGRPISPNITRQQFGLLSILYRLKAKIDISAIAEEEVKATGWDRSDYAL
jgi:predicted unusual protein kinase regulating ubiquinone biosynthesis (AarF/ABC1/UbiB family)